MYNILLMIHTIIVLFLIVMILLQRTDSDGLGGLGGGGGNQFLTGRSQATLITRVTTALAGAFMFTSLLLAIMAGRMTEGSILDKVEQVPVEAPAATAPATAAETAPTPAETPAVPKPE